MGSIEEQPFSYLSKEILSGSGLGTGWATLEHLQSCPIATILGSGRGVHACLILRCIKLFSVSLYTICVIFLLLGRVLEFIAHKYKLLPL